MTEDCIQLKIPNSREKLRTQFPQDNRGDFKIVFKSKVFKLQKAYLRLQSGYFKKECTATVTILQIQQNFNISPSYLEEQYFSNVLSCFYGNKINVHRSKVLQYYPIIKFLEVDSLLGELRKDMVQNISCYELFVLMQLAHKFNQQQCFESCLKQLEKEGFEQMNYSTWELLRCPVELFKLIIKTHNRKKSQGGKGLEYKAIDSFIKQYCESNGFGEDKYHEYKFQLIDKTRLTAKQYKEIFMDELSKPKLTKQSFIKTAEPATFNYTQSTNILNNSTKPMFDSFLNSEKQYSNELALEMENTFHKKQNQQLKQQKQQLLELISKLKENTKINQQLNNQLQKQLEQLRERFKLKDKDEAEYNAVICRFQDRMKKMEKELKQKDNSIKKLESKVQQLTKAANKNYSLREEDNMLIQSRIIPANLIGNIMKKEKAQQTAKNSSLATTNDKTVLKSIDQDEIEEICHSRLNFDIEPISIPKIYIPTLVEFMGTDGFTQNKLKLIYRRSEKYPQLGTKDSLRNRKAIIMLIHTTTDQYIGGYISVTLQLDANDYIQDSNSFIFSLTKSSKFKVKQSNKSEALYINQHYLLCFGNDLFISNDVLKEVSLCDWSSSYQKGKLQQQGAQWFAGGNEFMIKDLQFYQVDEDDMVMTLD